jgi:hypothetical protein
MACEMFGAWKYVDVVQHATMRQKDTSNMIQRINRLLMTQKDHEQSTDGCV